MKHPIDPHCKKSIDLQMSDVPSFSSKKLSKLSHETPKISMDSVWEDNEEEKGTDTEEPAVSNISLRYW